MIEVNNLTQRQIPEAVLKKMAERVLRGEKIKNFGKLKKKGL